MTKNELVEYGDYLFSVAISRLDNFEDARDLVSETMYAALCAIEKGVVIDSPKAYLSGVLNHKLMDRLRIKYSKHVVYYGVIPDFESADDETDWVLKDVIKSEEAENIRRSLSKLTQNYRDVLVRYYFYGQKVSEIADELGLNENTVKFRLSYGRQDIKENFEMEKFEKQSFDPERLTVGMFGFCDLENGQNPFNVNNADRTLDQNIMIIAYEKPVSVEEIAGALGVAVAFIEPIIERLVQCDFMKRAGNKVYTNMIISTDDDKKRICKNDRKVVEQMYPAFWDDMDAVFADLAACDYFKGMSDGEKRNFKQFAIISLMQNLTFAIKQDKFPDFSECKQTEENSHKGWWGYAHGHRTNPKLGQDWSGEGFIPYAINGCFTYPIEDYKGLKRLGVSAYDLSSGRTFTAWWSAPKYISETVFLKCCYAIYSGHEEDIPDISKDFLEDIEYFIERGILRKENGKVMLNIPVLKNDDDAGFEKYLKQKADELAKKYKPQLEKLFDEKISYPSHIKGIPEFIQYEENGSYFPMAMVYRATADRYLVGEDLSKNPVPAMYLFVYDK